MGPDFKRHWDRIHRRLFLLESIVFPSKIVKDGFETVEVTTAEDNDYILGIKVRETKEELVLKDATRAEIMVPLKSIKDARISRCP